ncbi:hypothetical protein A2348_05290 [Candidatus Uhrbacteria bacterium RIFOXYB12_FULL_58_10]|nr:MAG: hypothetical protein A2348_05290 [Candidatus Uhrbacteria bacterium RIFOXYB12_FULL_58_10]
MEPIPPLTAGENLTTNLRLAEFAQGARLRRYEAREHIALDLAVSAAVFAGWWIVAALLAVVLQGQVANGLIVAGLAQSLAGIMMAAFAIAFPGAVSSVSGKARFPFLPQRGENARDKTVGVLTVALFGPLFAACSAACGLSVANGNPQTEFGYAEQTVRMESILNDDRTATVFLPLAQQIRDWERARLAANRLIAFAEAGTSLSEEEGAEVAACTVARGGLMVLIRIAEALSMEGPLGTTEQGLLPERDPVSAVDGLSQTRKHVESLREDAWQRARAAAEVSDKQKT